MATGKAAKQRAEQSRAIILPTVRGYRSWSPQLLQSAEYAADSGNIRLAVDLCEWLLGDDKVRGSLDSRVDAVFGAPITFEASGDRRRQNRAVRALEAGEDWDAIYPEPEARQCFRWAVLLGMGPGVFRWEVREDHENRDVPRLEFYHPQPLRYDWAGRSWKTKTGGGYGAEADITFGDGVWFAHMPFGTYRPWSLGLWRALSRWVLLKQYAISDWGRAGEAAVRQVVTADKEVKATKETRRELADQIADMGRDGVIILPPGYDYKTIELTASTKDLFNAQIATANLAIAITIKRGNLTSDVQGGSRAAAEVHERVDEKTAASDAGTWSVTTHDQGLTYWADSNYGDDGLAPWAVYATEPEEDRKAKAEVLVSATTGAKQATDLGFELDRKAFASEFGLDGFLKPGAAPKAPPAPAPKQNPPAPPADRGQRRAIHLASGGSPKESPGFVEGQLYADALAENGAELGSKLATLTLDAIREEIDAAKDYADLRARLRSRYGEMSAADFAELVYRHMVVAELAGHHAVNRDAGT